MTMIKCEVSDEVDEGKKIQRNRKM